MNKILHLSTNDFGGAGKAAYRLHRNLLAFGMDSRMLVMNRSTGDTLVTEALGKYDISRLKRLLAKAWLRIRSNRDYGFQTHISLSIEKLCRLLSKIEFKPDAIVAHWISNFANVTDLRDLSKTSGVPVVWYLVDMAPLTGGCHYAWDCNGYKKKCGMCPALNSINAYDLSHRIWREKLVTLRGLDLDVVVGSAWLERQARQSSLFRDRKICKILLSVDPDIFSPIPRSAARQKLRLPEDKKIIFVGSQRLGQKRKGMSYLVEALRRLAVNHTFDKKKVVAAVAGDFQNEFELPLEWRNLGFLANDEMLALAYQAADVFVCPSVEDSGPMMINESIMCGTPVVSFEMGVAPDLVHTGLTGYRAKLGDSEDLARGIESILELATDDAVRMSSACRELGIRLCHPRCQVESFKMLIERKSNTDLAIKE